MTAKTPAIAMACLAISALAGCRHPLAIVGQGDIIELNGSGRGCSFEQYAAKDPACAVNEVEGDYFVNYRARPRPGWRFVRWEGPCAADSDFGHCRLQIPAAMVAKWDASDEDLQAPPSTAVFQPVSGNTGYLLAGTPVAGVAYTTATQQGVTGLDGSFQYAEGERVRFAIGATVLGEVAGRPRVTPFELARSPRLRGIRIAWALRNEDDPFQRVINLTVLLHSLDRDGLPGNGIVITRGVAELLAQVQLAVRQRVEEFGDPGSEGGTMLVAQDWERFFVDPTLRHLLGRANRGQRFSAPHGLAQPAIAIPRLYQALGIDPRLYALSYSQTGNPQDGDNWARYSYDSAGRLVEHEISGFGGGTERWQYNERGQMTLHQQDADEVDHHLTTVSSYDGRGNLTHSETQFGGNNSGWTGYRLELNRRYDRDGVESGEENVRASEEGSETEVETHSHNYDSHGRLVRHISGSEFAYSDGSSFHSVDYFDYRHDNQGNLRYYSSAQDVQDVDGVPENTSSWWYDKAGRVTRAEWTSAIIPDPQAEPAHWVRTWQYDALGKVARYQDGDETWWFRYRYDDDGRTVRREQVLAASGAVGEIVTWSYDGRGRVTRREITSIGTSPYNTGERHTALQSWQYHANGRVSRYTHEKADAVTDLGASFAISEQEEYQFDNRGNLTHYTSLLGIDSGEPQEPYQRTYSWQYDSAGNLVRAEAANGEERSIQTWQYDANGNPTAYQGDEDGDGMYEQSAQYRYQKTGWGFLFAGVSPFGSNLPLPEKPGQSFDYIPPPQPPPVVPGR